jgi:predicted metal-binding membrane protein
MGALVSGRLVARGEALIAAALLALAVLAWALANSRMAGMDGGPGTDPGSIGFFVVVWVVMMAAMMFPSIVPMVVVYDRVARVRGGTELFVAGYLVTWTVAGVVAYALFALGRLVLGDALAWHNGGRWVAGGVIAAAALYQLTPLKDRCLRRCRGPLSFVMERWRDGRVGALRMGLEHGGWCVGCCWALMASLFALGVMSVAWMAFIAALIAIEKLLPWRRLANRSIAVVLLAVGIAVAATPERVPALTVPGSGDAMSMQAPQHDGAMQMRDASP